MGTFGYAFLMHSNSFTYMIRRNHVFDVLSARVDEHVRHLVVTERIAESKAKAHQKESANQHPNENHD